MGERRYVDPKSHSIKDVVTFDVHPDVTVPDEMCRMCPVFAQRRKEIDEKITDRPAATSLAYGSIAYVDEYTSSATSIRDVFYRIYVELVDIVVDDNNYADDARELPNDIFKEVQEADVQNNKIILVVQVEYIDKWNMFQDEQQIAAVDTNNVYGCTLAKIEKLSIRDNEHTVELYADTSEDAKLFAENVKNSVYWIPKISATRSDVVAALLFFQKRDAVAPAIPYGILSRYENSLALENKVILSVMMMGQAYLLVQPNFYETTWIPGERVYAHLQHVPNVDTTTKKYEIVYVHESDIDDIEEPDIYFYVGLYMNESDHAHYRVCTLTLPPLVEENIYKPRKKK